MQQRVIEPDRTSSFLPGPSMDEQAGPGVFFGGGGSGSGGTGSVRAPQPGDGEAARAHYSIPGILHYLQHEWARFEVERAQWDVERAELQVSPRFGSGRMLNDIAASVGSVVPVGLRVTLARASVLETGGPA